MAPFPRDIRKESALANLMVDVVLLAGKKQRAQFAIIPSAFIRLGFSAGTVRYDDLYRSIPFNNTIIVATLTGRQLRRSVELAMSSDAIGAFAGLQVQLLDKPVPRDLNQDGKLEKWEENSVAQIFDQEGHALVDDEIYRVATIDFYTLGGDHQDLVFSQLNPSQLKTSSQKITRDLVVDFLKVRPTISPSEFFKV